MTVRPVDVTRSDIDCTLEPIPDSAQPALRLGLNRVKGLSKAAMQRLIAARGSRVFAGIEDLARRAELNQKDLQALAGADALKPLAGHRHRSAWQALGAEPELPLAMGAAREAEPLLDAPTEGANIVADYASTDLTLGRHPLALLRDQLARRHIKTAADACRLDNGRPVRIAGLVTHRQRPGGGHVVFVTLEDESGYVNAIVRSTVAERDRQALLDAQLLGVAGIVQCQEGVFHVIAGKLIDYTALLGNLEHRSRDFR